MPNTDREHLEAIVAAKYRFEACIGKTDLPEFAAIEDDLTNAFAAAKHHIASTPDTGGVEGRYREGDTISVTWYGVKNCLLRLSGEHRWIANAAYSEGHKAGASGSGEAAEKLASDWETRADEYENASKNHRVVGNATNAGVSMANAIMLRECAFQLRATATQNPASGSDGLRESDEVVALRNRIANLTGDSGSPGYKNDMQNLQRRLAAALSDGGMGDE